MLYLSRKMYFSSLHSYRVKEWSDEYNQQVFGPCSNPNGHGHDYTLEVMVKGKLNRQSGIVVNITDIDKVVKSFVAENLDGKFLNMENDYFKHHIPTTENIATYLWESLDGKIDHCQIHKIRLHENNFLYSEKEDGQMVRLTRKYHFCTAHRLHSEQLSEEENQELFGKCNNPYGHGHNYYLEVTVNGEPDPVTGMIANLSDIDSVVEKEIMEKFDHKHLNLDTEEFKDLNPTSENVAVVIWDLLSPQLTNLFKIGLYETEKNYFEYCGPQEDMKYGA
ncbi:MULTISPECIES: 6-carboxytetrahydropterin synthase [Bacillus]|uniref:6-carboxy-5,6,7,8-tetrahydropterin synthase n=1 Tax=Bacillus xiamenensis TaxID=1178537 RepID=A0ABT4F9B9_9BACI|nr:MULTISPECIES: 6-carboxytetrahydropterin synthase [Bacillus]MBG9911655.1 6-pyruvoyl tetrahydropterin synthase [Bacillus xiamenensis]MCW1838358.1 6-carboxytetrahydropterin synthase [Bacillus xiamenensis]MCY9577181.1 6-carboxytetrahydropterin synthase [Bacillus xiamenensis]QGX64107.1 6-pyruvoyl tetrahydropterin synthase [Bacillus sp. ms-22]